MEIKLRNQNKKYNEINKRSRKKKKKKKNETNVAIIDVATGRIFIVRPPNMYSDVVFCLCFEKNP